MPQIGEHDDFEQRYMAKLDAILASCGLRISYTTDRAALDRGIHLYEPGTPKNSNGRQISQTRIWLQAKGVHQPTLPIDEFNKSTHIPIEARSDHLLFWYASPEPVYIVVYIESADIFLAEDVREIADRQWSQGFGGVTVFQAASGKKSMTLRVKADARLDTHRLEGMLRHRSIRIDGPSFRGRPLGHHLDPLRSELSPPGATEYRQIIERILEAHEFHPTDTNATNFDPCVLQGILHHTLEWHWPLGTQIGVSLESNYRRESSIESIQGSCTVIIESDASQRQSVEDLSVKLQRIIADNADPILIFSNTEELYAPGPWLAAARMVGVSTSRLQVVGLGSLSYMLLVATLVYIEFSPMLKWRYASYLT